MKKTNPNPFPQERTGKPIKKKKSEELPNLKKDVPNLKK